MVSAPRATPPPPRTATPPPPRAKAPAAEPVKPAETTPVQQTDLPWEESVSDQPTVAPPAPSPSPVPAKAAPSAKAPAVTGFSRAKAGNSGSRIILTAVEGWGKTSTAAFSDDPDSVAMILSEKETGYGELLKKKLVPEVDCVQIRDWNALIKLLRDLAAGPNRFYRVLAMDALVGFERLCHEFVCIRDYQGNWGNKGFSNFQQGYQVAINDWLMMLSLLDQIREKGTHIILLGHILIKTFKNPAGPDFDRYTSDLHEKTWSQTYKWADVALFGNFITVISDKNGKPIDGKERVIYTERCDAWDAKNRYGMPERIDVSKKPQETWGKIAQHLPELA